GAFSFSPWSVVIAAQLAGSREAAGAFSPPSNTRTGPASGPRWERCHSVLPRTEGEFAMRLLKQTSLRVEPLEDRSLPSAGFVLDWNDLVVDVQRVRGQGNQAAARALAMVGAAVYDSVNAINPTHTVYHVDARGFPNVSIASADAAAAQAAHDVAYALYTQTADRTRFNGLLDTHLGELLTAGVTGVDEGKALGQFVASEVLAWRANDHSGDTMTYTPGTGPGVWQPTPRPGPTPGTELPGLPATSPQWPLVTPFAMTSGDQFRPGPPPALTDADYTEAYLEVKALGGNGTTT